MKLYRSIGSITGCVMLLASFCLAAPAAGGMETAAKQAYIVDLQTEAVLLEKDSGTPSPPASLSKLMTIYMVFEQLKSGKLSLDDKFVVSRKAWKTGGSKMFVEIDKQVRVEDLLRGIIVQSGNDAGIVLAEGLSGSEAAFVDAMNRKARDIGLGDSHFVNATGWPADGHMMSTARHRRPEPVASSRNIPSTTPISPRNCFATTRSSRETATPCSMAIPGRTG